MWHMGDGWGWWVGFGSIWMVGIWVVIIWADLTLKARGIGEQDRMAKDECTALEILERRYARGELSDDQYEALRVRRSQPPEPTAAERGAVAPSELAQRHAYRVEKTTSRDRAR